ncbi:KilA-N domain-containing protein [Butyrivibrio sp. WCD3002]|uniref:KilA-N domain-containing protein n=1 Tax=Butyrivibrio sp. WCD3002 TaxID=1280676 RepID=UPI001FA7F4CA|nr:KilA-N domain-containing protein [Butyrivibrio sp. WCD3002]
MPRHQVLSQTTDIAKTKNSLESRVVISNWLSSYSTIDFLALWESLYNPNLNRMEFHTVRNESGRLVMTPTRWIEKMNAIGITSKAGKYGGTYAHVDIAFEFASYIGKVMKYLLMLLFLTGFVLIFAAFRYDGILENNMVKGMILIAVSAVPFKAFVDMFNTDDTEDSESSEN